MKRKEPPTKGSVSIEPQLVCSSVPQSHKKRRVESKEPPGDLRLPGSDHIDSSQENVDTILQDETITSVMKCNIDLPLPNELWMHIFSFLPASDLANVLCTCKLWRALADEDSVWGASLAFYFGGTPLESRKRTGESERKICWKDFYHSTLQTWRSIRRLSEREQLLWLVSTGHHVLLRALIEKKRAALSVRYYYTIINLYLVNLTTTSKAKVKPEQLSQRFSMFLMQMAGLH